MMSPLPSTRAVGLFFMSLVLSFSQFLAVRMLRPFPGRGVRFLPAALWITSGCGIFISYWSISFAPPRGGAFFRVAGVVFISFLIGT